MPRLNAEQVRTLMQVLELTEEEELDCDGCLDRMAELVEKRLAGVEAGEAMRLVEAHLAICPECVEELDAIRAAIEAFEQA